MTDPSELSDQRVNVIALAGAAAGIWCGVGCLMAFVAAHRRRSGDLLWQRKRHARRAAERKLAEARKAMAEGQSRTRFELFDRRWSGWLPTCGTSWPTV